MQKEPSSFLSTRRVVRMALVAALYTVLTLVLAPISFGPLQFRVANLLMALMLFDMDWCFGLALGVFFANLASPFGPLDFAVMPIITFIGAVSAYKFRNPIMGIVAWALITSAGVAIFPLGMGANLPVLVTFPAILFSQLVLGYIGYAIFKPFRIILTPLP